MGMRSLLLALGALALLALVPFFPQVVYPVFAMRVMCLALFACAFNILLGHTGILSFGHAAFFGSAAYFCGYMLKELGLSPEIGIVTGVAAASLLGAIFGALATRRSGIYLAMITLALSQLVYFLFLRLPWTHAEDGMQQIPRGVLLGILDLDDDVTLYFVVLVLTLAGLALVHRIVNSPFGEVLRAIREHEPRAISLGYPVARYKILAFTLSAGLSGLAGSLKVIVYQVASLRDVHWSMSGDVILMTLLGGMNSVFGPVIGAALISSLYHYFDALGGWVTIMVGAIFIACVLTFRRGIVGELEAALATRRSTTSANDEKDGTNATN
ncbi:branched-chain amino acid ABC transporter permease [Salinarimonas ramus]|uniref:Branched-chain amino acid ABC transporter permease n=1 Tax=Salinarimonas ramus TaxID=690164 RepID=A0A917Q4K5_9HYPH|nr:branched-chain amino acid ABC transporter permease [Salinarimonas ramus]GGK20930.1 branched-chain amino acid ABC transporter permease [Salinarimonas ramus]